MLKHALFALALALPAAAQGQLQVEQLAWLSGVWEGGSPEEWVEEHWSAPRGGVLVGYTRYGEGDALNQFEFFRVEAGEDGVPVLYAQPQGRAAVAFRLANADVTSATFENAAHDYPQRIRYRREGDTLTATISLLDGSEATSFTFRRR